MQTIATMIHSLRITTPELEELAAKRVRLYTGDGGHASMASAPLPINLTATDLINQLTELAMLLCRIAGMHPVSGMNLAGLLTGLDRPFAVERLESRADAEDIRCVLASALRHVAWVVEPDDRIKWVGVCANCGYGIWVSHYTDIAHDSHVCEMCGQKCDLATVFAAHRLMLMMSDVTDTAAGLAQLLRSCGYDAAKRNTITQWGRRGRLTMAGVDDSGTPVYRLSDVLRLLG